jgi:hypothetical protein
MSQAGNPILLGPMIEGVPFKVLGVTALKLSR